MSKGEQANYIKLGIIIIVTIFLTLVVCNLYRNYDNNKAKESYISKYVSTISYKDLKDAVTELDSNSFIYLSYTGNKNIFDLEKKLRKVLKQYDLEEHFIYVDCTDAMESNGTIRDLKDLFIVENKEIVLPAIIYFKDNKPVDYTDSENLLFNVGDFSQMLDKYEIEARK